MKEIGLGGLDLRGGDGSTADGSLGYMSNVIVEDGGLKIGVLGESEAVFPRGVYVLAIHEVVNGRNYIVTDSRKVGWVSGDAGDVVESGSIHWFEETGHFVRSLGNVLTFYSYYAVEYAIWRDDHYDWLGRMPETPELIFDLRLYSDFDKSGWDAGRVYRLDSKGLQGVSETDREERRRRHRETHRRLISHANELIGRHRDKFCYPFFVRYAYRLYDGTLTKHSAPVLMLPSERLNPVFLNFELNTVRHDTEVELKQLHGALVYGDLLVKCRGVASNLVDWKDLITGVEVYVSAPVYSYLQDPSNEDMDDCWQQFPFQSLLDEGKKGAEFLFFNRHDYHHGCALRGHASLADLWQRGWGTHRTIGVELGISTGLSTNGQDDVSNDLFCYSCVPKKEADLFKEIEGCGQFYHYASYDLSEVLAMAGRDERDEPLVVESDVTDLRTLPARKVMSDDATSHLRLVARTGFVYNNRLNLANLTKYAFEGFPLQCTVQHYEAGVSDKGCWLYIRRKKNGKEIVTRRKMKLNYPSEWFDERKQRTVSYVFVPDIDAFELIVSEGDRRVMKLPLKRHPVLNGSYWFGRFNHLSLVPSVPITLTVTGFDYEQPNQLYLSEAGNPFVFPAKLAVTVDDRRILGLASASVALSEGQFGQFPLYAFTDGGIWSLSVGDDGSYKARQPVSRDICLGEGGSVTQLDRSVVFASSRGVMLLEGSEVVCLSDALDGKSGVDLTRLPMFDRISHAFRYNNSVGEEMLTWREFLDGVKLAYDYCHHRLYALNGKVDYVYVLDLHSKVWGVTNGMGYDRVVPSYPNAYVMAGSRLVNLSKPVRRDDGCGLVVTRPLSLGDGSLLKVMRRLEVRGHLRRHVGKLLLWGSRDGFTWHYLGSSGSGVMRWLGGSGYRWFCVGVGLEGMSGDECLRGIGVEVTMG